MSCANVTIAGRAYEIAASLTEVRAFIRYEGLIVLAAVHPETHLWELSGDPASPEEMVILKKLTERMTDTTEVTVTENPET